VKRFILGFAVLALPFTVRAQDADFIRANFTKSEVLIPMRDGVRLFTSIFTPRDTSTRHPIVLMRTPYSVEPYGRDSVPQSVDNQVRAYMHQGYIIVRQDVRGRYMSEGEFADVRPVIVAPKSNRDIDESTDTYDTAEWLIHNVHFNNGNIGVRGTSYPGFYSSMAAI
jgi:putative CocE/NonD family hydrolase